MQYTGVNTINQSSITSQSPSPVKAFIFPLSHQDLLHPVTTHFSHCYFVRAPSPFIRLFLNTGMPLSVNILDFWAYNLSGTTITLQEPVSRQASDTQKLLVHTAINIMVKYNDGSGNDWRVVGVKTD
ncbi:hypothetical protein FNI11_18545 [Salmonella enterica subsp. salamae]|nr:hypothetical protein [Salmonella enterica subsp. salamae]ECJ2280866.1 hypothetical protein [Salmonella enterica subsp. salamae]